MSSDFYHRSCALNREKIHNSVHKDTTPYKQYRLSWRESFVSEIVFIPTAIIKEHVIHVHTSTTSCRVASRWKATLTLDICRTLEHPTSRNILYPYRSLVGEYIQSDRHHIWFILRSYYDQDQNPISPKWTMVSNVSNNHCSIYFTIVKWYNWAVLRVLSGEWMADICLHMVCMSNTSVKVHGVDEFGLYIGGASQTQ